MTAADKVIEALPDIDARRLNEAMRSYGALTGRAVSIEAVIASPSLAQSVTSLMADIYRRDMRRELLGEDY